MKKIALLLPFILLSVISFAQFVARAEIKEKIDGLCDNKNVYVLLEMLGDQKEAVCAVKNAEIEKMLADSVTFLKDKGDYKDKGIVSMVINCKGEVVQCKIDNKTKSEALDEQIVKVFKSLTSFKAGKLNGKNVDSMKLWGFDIVDGKIKIN